jgi:hypothetical protein
MRFFLSWIKKVTNLILDKFSEGNKTIEKKTEGEFERNTTEFKSFGLDFRIVKSFQERMSEINRLIVPQFQNFSRQRKKISKLRVRQKRRPFRFCTNTNIVMRTKVRIIWIVVLICDLICECRWECGSHTTQSTSRKSYCSHLCIWKWGHSFHSIYLLWR